jgi:Delta24-sterol reductase
MQNLVKATLAYGLIPLVVPEFKSITVGGAIAGGALESSSFRYGQFHDTCLEYEVICQEERKSVSRDDPLFHAMSGSYGMFGRISKAVVTVQEAPKRVRVRYTRCATAKEALALLTASGADTLDAVGLTVDCWIAMEGYFCDEGADLPEAHLSHAWSEWYIDHLSSGVAEEWMPIEEYLFRYDRGAFWMGRYLVQPWHEIPAAIWEWLWSKPELAARLAKEHSTPSPLFRALFGWLASSEMLYRQLHHLEGDFFFIQDAYLPIERVEEALQWNDKVLGIYPVWLCPIKSTQEPQLFSPSYQAAPMLVNVGLYGAPGGDTRELTGEFERVVSDLGGRKMLYGLNTYTPERFWEIYDQSDYEQLSEMFDLEEIHLSRICNTSSSSYEVR